MDVVLDTKISKTSKEIGFKELLSLIDKGRACCLAQSRNRESLGILDTSHENMPHFKPVGLYSAQTYDVK